MAKDLAPIPIFDPIARAVPKKAGDSGEPVFITDNWSRYLTDLKDKIAHGAERLATVSYVGLQTSIAATAIPIAVITTGIYRVSYYFRVTVPAGVSSSIAVSFGFTEGGVSVTRNGVAQTGNTTQTVGTETWILLCDSASPITYSTTVAYAGSPVTHNLYIVAEALAL